MGRSGVVGKVTGLTTRRVDVTERGLASRLPKKYSRKRSDREGLQEKVRGRRSVGEGMTKKEGLKVDRWKSGRKRWL